MKLSAEDLRNIRTGALFLACSVDQLWCLEQADRTLAYMEETGRHAELLGVEQLDDDDLVVTIGFVNNGLPLSDLSPVGDEFEASLRLMHDKLGERAKGLLPLAGANINALVPIHTSMQVDIPVIDADPQGRVFPLLHQTVFTLAHLPAGPVVGTGPTGESATVDVRDPFRAERFVRSLASDFGGWSATALYPMRARELRAHGLHGSLSRLRRIGEILGSEQSIESKRHALTTEIGVRRMISARVVDVAGLSRPSPPGHPDRPASVLLHEEDTGRIIQIEIQNELLMLLVDGVIEAEIPDIITLLHADDLSVAGFEDLWVGNRLEIMVLRGAEPWYSPAGLELAGSPTNQISARRRLQRSNA